jgi:hypothetical protein
MKSFVLLSFLIYRIIFLIISDIYNRTLVFSSTHVVEIELVSLIFISMRFLSDKINYLRNVY